MAKVKGQSLAEGQTSKADRTTGPVTRNSPRKATPSAKKASATAAQSTRRVTKKTSPNKTTTAKVTSPSPGKPKAVAKTTTQKVATRSASPAKTAATKVNKEAVSPKKGSGRQRASWDEDDSGFDPEQTTDEILAEFDGRTRTRLDKELIEQIRLFEDGDEMQSNFACQLQNEEANEDVPIDCNYKLYWRFRKCFAESDGGFWTSPRPKSPSSKSKAKARGPTRSPNKLVGGPDLPPGAMKSRASPKGRQKRASPELLKRAKSKSASPLSRQKHYRLTDRMDRRADTAGEVEIQAYDAEIRKESPWTYDQVPAEHITKSEFKGAQKRGKMRAQNERTESTFRLHADASEQGIEKTLLDTGIAQSVFSKRSKTPSMSKGRQLSAVHATPGRSSPGRPLMSSSSPQKKMAKTPVASPSRSKSTSPTKTKRDEQAPRSPAKKPYERKHYGNDHGVRIGADAKNRGTIVPPIQKDWVAVRDPKNPAKKAEDRQNPFYETMPGPEVWHRRMPPYFPFGETPYMEKILSDQINEDLKRTHEEEPKEVETPKRSSSLVERMSAIPGKIIGSLWGRSPDRETTEPQRSSPAKTFMPPEDVEKMLQPASWPWHLPYFRSNTASSSRKRSASKEPSSPSKRRRV